MADINLNFLSWSVRELGDYQKRRKLFSWVKKKHTSKNVIVFMQETHSMGTTVERIDKILSWNNLQ